jgi:hypothetical protein
LQAISNLAGFAYTYGIGGATSSERDDPVEFVPNEQLDCYDIQHPQTISVHYEYAHEVHSENQHLQESVRTNDDDYYYAVSTLSYHMSLYLLMFPSRMVYSLLIGSREVRTQ